MTSIAKSTTRLIAIYGRVSTSRQEEDGTIETQLAAIRAFTDVNELTIVREYTDDGWSGDTLQRPALDQLRQDAKAKLWNAVLIYDPDRLARRYSYQELVMDELKEAGIEVLFVTIPTPKNSEDKILYGVRGLFAEYERTKIAERFRLGKLRKINEGHILVSTPLYGYDYVRKNDKQPGYYQINEDEARIVRMIFVWVAGEDLNIRQVVRRLQEIGIKPRKSNRGVWSTSTLTTMLRNRAYMGEAHWRSSIAVVPKNPTNKDKYRKQKKSSRMPRPKDEWLMVPVPPILDAELFEKARDRIESHAITSIRNKKYEYLLGTLMWCDCGQKRVGAGRKLGRYLYYDCCGKILCFPLPRECYERSISARVADKLVWDKITELMTSPELLSQQIERWMNSHQDKAMVSIGDTDVMKKEIAKLTDEESRYTKAFGAGLLSMEQLKEYVAPVRDKIASLKQQIGKAEAEAERVGANVLPTAEEMKAFAKKSLETLPDLNFEQKRAIVLNTVEKIIGTQQQLQVFGYIPVTTTTTYGGYTTKDRNRRTAERREIDAF